MKIKVGNYTQIEMFRITITNLVNIHKPDGYSNANLCVWTSLCKKNDALTLLNSLSVV